MRSGTSPPYSRSHRVKNPRMSPVTSRKWPERRSPFGALPSSNGFTCALAVTIDAYYTRRAPAYFTAGMLRRRFERRVERDLLDGRERSRDRASLLRLLRDRLELLGVDARRVRLGGEIDADDGEPGIGLLELHVRRRSHAFRRGS